jgi:AcrR family transcriptional regulator
VTITSRERNSQLCADIESSQPLPQAAREFVEAAKQLVERKGFGALTLQRVADEVGGNKASIWYYFGGKDGLIEAVIHDNVLENCAWIARNGAAVANEKDAVEQLVRTVQHLLENPSAYAGGFDVFAYSVRHEKFRAQWARMYEVWFQSMREQFGFPEGDGQVRAHSQALAAMVDGLAMQKLMGLADEDRKAELLESVRVCAVALLHSAKSASIE